MASTVPCISCNVRECLSPHHAEARTTAAFLGNALGMGAIGKTFYLVMYALQGAEQRAITAQAAADEATRLLHGAQADVLTLRHELGSRIKDHDIKVRYCDFEGRQILRQASRSWSGP